VRWRDNPQRSKSLDKHRYVTRGPSRNRTARPLGIKAKPTEPHSPPPGTIAKPTELRSPHRAPQSSQHHRILEKITIVIEKVF